MLVVVARFAVATVSGLYWPTTCLGTGALTVPNSSCLALPQCETGQRIFPALGFTNPSNVQHAQIGVMSPRREFWLSLSFSPHSVLPLPLGPSCLLASWPVFRMDSHVSLLPSSNIPLYSVSMPAPVSCVFSSVHVLHYCWLFSIF